MTILDTSLLRPSSADVETSLTTGRGALLGWRHVSLLTFAALVLVIGATGGSSVRYALILGTVYGIAVLGNNAIAATLNEISLGAAPYIAIGSYSVAYFTGRGLGLVLSALIGILLAGVVGLLLAIPTTRLRGIPTALVTFALAYAVLDFALWARPVTGGDEGLFVLVTPTIGPMTVSGSNIGMLLVATIAMTVSGVVFLQLLNRRPGRMAILAGEAPAPATVFGTRVTLVRLLVWTFAAVLGGLSGVVYSLVTGFVSPSQFAVNFSLLLFVGGLVGGTRSATGAWIGGLLVGSVPLWLQGIISPAATGVVYGIVLLVALLSGGRGVSEAGERLIVRLVRTVRR